jgi:hypothetical protein
MIFNAMADSLNHDARGKFAKGNRANPRRGRAKGSKNKATIYEQMLGEHGKQAVQAFIVEAIKNRTPSLLAYYVSRLVPHRGARFAFDAPKMRGLDDMPAAIAAVRAMVADGVLTLDEGQTLISTYTAQAQAIETVELKQRLEAMEAELAELRQREDE